MEGVGGRLMIATAGRMFFSLYFWKAFFETSCTGTCATWNRSESIRYWESSHSWMDFFAACFVVDLSNMAIHSFCFSQWWWFCSKLQVLNGDGSVPNCRFWTVMVLFQTAGSERWWFCSKLQVLNGDGSVPNCRFWTVMVLFQTAGSERWWFCSKLQVLNGDGSVPNCRFWTVMVLFQTAGSERFILDLKNRGEKL